MIVDTDQYVAIAGLNPTAIQASASALQSRDLKGTLRERKRRDKPVCGKSVRAVKVRKRRRNAHMLPGMPD